MPHRAHLFSLRICHALLESCFAEPYSTQRFAKDVIAGITLGIIAIPLAMALAIASGVAPQYGLYSAMVAGFFIALTGGSRYSISGPTAAFVVILYPITQQFGLGGLLVATLMAGLILVALALARLGRLIEYIPEPVTLGFTSGIAIVIATLQFRDFFGLDLAELPESWLAKVETLLLSLPQLDPASLLVGASTLGLMIIWPRLRLPVPGHLPALVLGVALSLLLGASGFEVDTIGTRFSYLLADGTRGQGIPPVLPSFEWPWLRPGPAGAPLEWSFDIIRTLLPAAFTIAMLGAIESLLCAVVLDGMTGRRHNANSELLGQGIGNLIAPFFGGITATAAIARSAANFRAGAQSPAAAMIHALVVMAALLAFAPLLSWLPMASMAAMLLMVAWNMSEAHKVVALIRKAPMGDILVLAVCLSLTVLFDMVIAIGTGIVLASLLFVRDLAAMTKVSEISGNRRLVPEPLPQNWSLYKINGPLFFAAADRVFSELELLSRYNRGVLLYLDGVPMLDAGGLAALEKFIASCRSSNIELLIADLQFQPLKALARAGIRPIEGQLSFSPTLAEALERVSNRSRIITPMPSMGA